MRFEDVAIGRDVFRLHGGREFGRDSSTMETSRNTTSEEGMGAHRYIVRRATPDDFSAIQHVETRAADRFNTVGLGFIAKAPPLPTQRLAQFCSEGGLHVLAFDARVVGMAAHAVLDGEGYLAELDVLPEHAGKRLGLRLLSAVEACLQARGHTAVWLITYRDVPWNGPYYLRAGFTEQAPHPGSQLAARLVAERAGPLGVQPRVAMRKALV